MSFLFDKLFSRRRKPVVDPAVRRFVRDELSDIETSENLQSELDEAERSLKIAQDKEIFLQQRIVHYETVVDKDSPHFETLQNVKKTHRDILIEIVRLERNIKELTRKQQQCNELSNNLRQTVGEAQNDEELELVEASG